MDNLEFEIPEMVTFGSINGEKEETLKSRMTPRKKRKLTKQERLEGIPKGYSIVEGSDLEDLSIEKSRIYIYKYDLDIKEYHFLEDIFKVISQKYKFEKDGQNQFIIHEVIDGEVTDNTYIVTFS